MAKKELLASELKLKKTPMIERTPKRATTGKRGLALSRFLASLFKINETLPRNKKMTDGEIARQVCEEYSKHKEIRERYSHKNEDLNHTICKNRSEYNRGRLVPADGPPEPKYISFSYNENGDPVNTRYAIPRVLTEKQKTAYRDKYNEYYVAFKKAVEGTK